MESHPELARIAALIGDGARARMLWALMGGEALTATELASAACVTQQTASSHLAKLLEAQILAVRRQGRHRYFSFARREIAQLLENLTNIAETTATRGSHWGSADPGLRRARVCYDHLAGDSGVFLFDSLVSRKLITSDTDGLRLTETGREFCRNFGIDLTALERLRRPLIRECLDWTARRTHLAGALGAAMLTQCVERGWVRRLKSSRVLMFTAGGEREFLVWFGRF